MSRSMILDLDIICDVHDVSLTVSSIRFQIKKQTSDQKISQPFKSTGKLQSGLKAYINFVKLQLGAV